MIMPLGTVMIHVGSHIMWKIWGEKLRPWILPAPKPKEEKKDNKGLLWIPKFGKSVKAFPTKKEEPETADIPAAEDKPEEKSEEIDDSSAKIRPKIIKNEPKVQF